MEAKTRNVNWTWSISDKLDYGDAHHLTARYNKRPNRSNNQQI